jgi:ribosomal protein S1
MSNRPISRPDEVVNVNDELTLLVIRVDPNERRIGLSLKELAHAIEMTQVEEKSGGGQGRRGRRGKQRADYDYDDDE